MEKKTTTNQTEKGKEVSIMIKVTRIHKIDNGSTLKAYADIEVADEVIVTGVRVMSKTDDPKALFVTMPAHKSDKDNKYYPNVKLKNKEAREELHSVVLAAYAEA